MINPININRALKIVVEGPTEREFVKECITPFFNNHGIYNVRSIGIETSPGYKGGDIRYARFKPNIETLLRGREDMIVTSFIDYYELRNDFPRFDESNGISDPMRRISFLEKACFDDINDGRFIPYIQLHEFEGLLFTRIDGFNDIEMPYHNRGIIREIIDQHPNPEFINSGPQSAPSKRLKSLIPIYQKPFHGPYITLANGFDEIMRKCSRFNGWIQHLLERMMS